MQLLRISLALCAIYSLTTASACGIKVEAVVVTDCIWYRVPPKLTDANREHFGQAPDQGNAGAFFDVARDNNRKFKEFCPAKPGLQK